MSMEAASPALAEAREAMARVFGFQAFRPGQPEILDAVFRGEDVLAVMPTGSGKSLCYQLPAICRPGLTVVVSPLIALMRDQVEALRANGIAAGALNSSNSGSENMSVERAIQERRLKLVYVAPERFALPGLIDLFKAGGAAMLAIDEAHCISQWGHDFRPEYLALREIAEDLGAIQTIAVTATADEPTRAEIEDKLFSRKPRLFLHSFDRPNLRLAMRRKANVIRQIAAFMEEHRGESGIVYASSRKRTEKIAEALSSIGHRAIAYHAGMDAELRTAHQDEFQQADGVVVVATIAFGMGIDKPDVRFVCHADLPQSIEAYYQEIGRAGRDGLPADTLTLWGEDDIAWRRKQIYDSEAPPERKRVEERRLEELVALAESPRCRRVTLLAAFGEASQPCGNCDVCAGEFKLFNGRIEAQKVMSAILRTSGRFFSQHIANILTGNLTESIKRHAHDRLKTFGVGKDRTPQEWRSIFRQLHASEMIEQDLADEGRWRLTPAGDRVLRGEGDIALRVDGGAKPKAEAQERVPVAPRATEGLTVDAQNLFAALKAKRLEIARAERAPAYVVFPDRSLVDMAQLQPRTLEEMRMVHGVGEAKLRRYGEQFLKVIRERG